MATPSPQDIQYQTSHASDNIGYQIIIPVAIWLALALVTYAARIYARATTKIGFGSDDWLLGAATFFAIGLSTVTFIQTQYGVGRHLLTLSKDDLVTIGKLSFALEFVYTPCLALGKLGVCSLYLRIFTQAGTWFKWAMYGTIVWIILWMIGTYLATFLVCVPAEKIWTENCAPTKAVTVATGVVNIISDFALLLLPQFIIWTLHMPLRRKLLVSVLLALGAFATAISIARIPLIEQSATEGVTDITYGLVVTDVLTVLEPLTVIICANLPPTQSLWVRFVGSGIGLSGIRSILRGRRSKTDDSSVELGGRRWDPINSTGTGNSTRMRTIPRDQEPYPYNTSSEGIVRTTDVNVTRYEMNSTNGYPNQFRH